MTTKAGRPERLPAVTADPQASCVTCSDQAAAVPVLRLLGGGMAEVATATGTEEISVALVPARVGDTVLVHAKEAIAVATAAGLPPATNQAGPV